MVIKIDYVSDIACPWCAVGLGGLEQAIKKSKRDKSLIALLLIDLDHFKEVNDTYGQDGGDELIVSAARRIEKSLRQGDRLARFGGDEFAILQAGCAGDDGPAALARRLLKTVSRSYRIENIELNVSVSIGIAICPPNGVSVDEIMRRADSALYQAKRSGRNRFCLFEEKPEILKAG